MTPLAKALDYCESVTVRRHPPGGGSAFTAEAVIIMPDGRPVTFRAVHHNDPEDAVMVAMIRAAMIRAVLAYHGEDRPAVGGGQEEDDG